MTKKNSTLKKFTNYYRPHLKLFILDLFCAFVVALCNLFYPTIAKDIINIYVPQKNLQLLIVWSVALLVIYFIKMLLSYIIQSWGHILGVRMQSDMRRDMFRHLQRLPYTYFDGHKTGVIMSGIVNDLHEVSELAHHGPEDLFLSLITIIGTFIMLIFVNVYLTLIVFCVIPFIVLFALLTRKKMMRAFAEMREKTARINADVETTVSGVRVTKAYAAENYAEERFGRVNRDFVKSRGAAYKAMGIFYSGMGFMSDFLYLAVLFAGGLFFFYRQIDAGEFAAFILYITMLITPIRSLVTIYEQIQSGMTGFSRFCSVMEEQPEKDNSKAKPISKVAGEINFNSVTFGYGDSGVLNGVSFTIPHGKTTALIGGSGGGKTTVCHLLMRFYDVDGGTITLDGEDINNITLQSLRSNMAIVAQDVFIFDGTVAENISFGKVDASQDEIIEAAKNAGIHDYILSMEDGYQTKVGERGVKLSGGQRQRISIARAFLKNPPILILDEATSALDNVTEAQIQNALGKLSKGRTVIVVAHRLSTIRNAHQIIVLENGRVVESGDHLSLKNNNGQYARLLEAQISPQH